MFSLIEQHHGRVVDFPGVNIAARLESIADPGGISISRTAYDQIEDKLPFGFEYLGEKTAKNLKKPLRAYKVNIWPESFGQKIITGHLCEKGKWFFEPSADESDPSKKKDKPAATKNRLFIGNVKAYLGVIGLLLLINILTYSGVIWLHWPVMGWGILLYLHWEGVSFSNKSGR